MLAERATAAEDDEDDGSSDASSAYDGKDTGDDFDRDLVIANATLEAQTLCAVMPDWSKRKCKTIEKQLVERALDAFNGEHSGWHESSNMASG
mmetsp:Transcript_84018/g.168257  ORF Transcript_84018/g.168257 Transcript_84018/m.168257 type:complete len:93 (+) Transcript_84018:862-1140(+)